MITSRNRNQQPRLTPKLVWDCWCPGDNHRCARFFSYANKLINCFHHSFVDKRVIIIIIVTPGAKYMIFLDNKIKDGGTPDNDKEIYKERDDKTTHQLGRSRSFLNGSLQFKYSRCLYCTVHYNVILYITQQNWGGTQTRVLKQGNAISRPRRRTNVSILKKLDRFISELRLTIDGSVNMTTSRRCNEHCNCSTVGTRILAADRR